MREVRGPVFDYYELPREALQNLYAIDPARAQARIVAEMAQARTWLDSPQLELLPSSAARIPDNSLIDALAAAQRPGGWNSATEDGGAGEICQSEGAASN